MKVRNTFAIFLVSGFWHGANWTFIIWGALNAIYFLPVLLTNNNRKNLGVVAEGKLLPSIKELFAMLSTFTLTVFAWIFFRADNVIHALNYIGGIFSYDLFNLPNFHAERKALMVIIIIVIFLFVEWYGRKDKFALENIFSFKKKIISHIIYLVIVVLILEFMFDFRDSQEFIYFQF